MEKEGPIWDDVITPIGINYTSSQTKPTMHCRYWTRENIKKKLFDVEKKLDSIEEFEIVVTVVIVEKLVI